MKRVGSYMEKEPYPRCRRQRHAQAVLKGYGEVIQECWRMNDSAIMLTKERREDPMGLRSYNSGRTIRQRPEHYR